MDGQGSSPVFLPGQARQGGYGRWHVESPEHSHQYEPGVHKAKGIRQGNARQGNSHHEDGQRNDRPVRQPGGNKPGPQQADA